MADDATPTDAAAPSDKLKPRTDLAVVVAALGGGPGDDRDAAARRDAPAVDGDRPEEDWPDDAAA